MSVLHLLKRITQCFVAGFGFVISLFRRQALGWSAEHKADADADQKGIEYVSFFLRHITIEVSVVLGLLAVIDCPLPVVRGPLQRI